MIQIVFCLAIGLCSACVIYRAARRGLLNFRYTVGWLVLCGISMFAGLLIPIIKPLASRLQLDAFSLVGASAIIVLLALCIQLSISISGLQRQLHQVNEDFALFKREVEKSRDS